MCDALATASSVAAEGRGRSPSPALVAARAPCSLSTVGRSVRPLHGFARRPGGHLRCDTLAAACSPVLALVVARAVCGLSGASWTLVGRPILHMDRGGHH